MEIDRNTLLILGALGIGAFYFMSAKNDSGNKFYVPGHGYVDESLLPSMGYQKINGQWYSPTQIDTATQQAGYPPGTQVSETMQTFNDIMAILNQLIPLAISTTNLIVSYANRPQVINAIIDKYCDPASPDYLGYPASWCNPTQLQAMTNQQLQTLLNTGSVNGINVATGHIQGINGVKKK